jgi:transcription antitermination factor NusG
VFPDAVISSQNCIFACKTKKSCPPKNKHTMNDALSFERRYPFSLTEMLWFVVVVPFNKEEKLQALLKSEASISSFIPTMLVKGRDAKGHFTYERKIALRNYVFVYSTFEQLNAFKKEKKDIFDFNFLCKDYFNNQIRIGRLPVTVPKHEMNNFIAVAGNEEEKIQYINPAEIDLTKGERVRITAGKFAGVEGIFIQLKKKHEKRVVVRIEGVTAVATTVIPASCVEKIPPKE